MAGGEIDYAAAPKQAPDPPRYLPRFVELLARQASGLARGARDPVEQRVTLESIEIVPGETCLRRWRKHSREYRRRSLARPVVKAWIRFLVSSRRSPTASTPVLTVGVVLTRVGKIDHCGYGCGDRLVREHILASSTQPRGYVKSKGSGTCGGLRSGSR